MESNRDFCEGAGLGIYLKSAFDESDEVKCEEVSEEGTFIGSDGVHNQEISEDTKILDNIVWPIYPES